MPTTKYTILGAFALLASTSIRAQVMCIQCLDQTGALDTNAVNLIQNGSFEDTDCDPYTIVWDVYCPASTSYSCNIADWTCTGGGTSTYALMYDVTTSTIPDGNLAAYLGSAFGSVCATADMSCVTDSACQVWGITTGYPTNAPEYGGSTGVSLEQDVHGLSIGASYRLEFWAGGENFPEPGIFSVDLGFGYSYFRCPPTPPGSIGVRYAMTFTATDTMHTVKFTNWGHLTSNASEVLIDDVRLYQVTHGEPCLSTAVHHVVADHPATVRPTLVTDMITINAPGNDLLRLRVLDASGRVVIDKAVRPNDQVDMNALSTGAFSYELTTAAGKRSVGRLVKR